MLYAYFLCSDVCAIAKLQHVDAGGQAAGVDVYSVIKCKCADFIAQKRKDIAYIGIIVFCKY